MRWGPTDLAGHLEDGHPPPVGGGDNGKEATAWGAAAWGEWGDQALSEENRNSLCLTLDNSC